MAFDFPLAPAIGDTFVDPVSGATYRWNGYAWAGGGQIPANLVVSDTPPSSPADNSLWWQSATGWLFLYYNDGNSKQWVQINSNPDGTFLKKLGISDGSDAPAGQIGEVISSLVSVGMSIATTTPINITSISLTPGDWDISGEVWFAPSAGLTNMYAAMNTVSAVLPTPAALNTARAQIVLATATPGGTTQIIALRTTRASLAVPTPYYLVSQANFASGTCTVSGGIWARRAR